MNAHACVHALIDSCAWIIALDVSISLFINGPTLF